MAISSLGAGSGLDLSGILTKLMQVEQQPLLVLQQKEAKAQARITALGSLKGALSALQTAASSLVPSSSQTAAGKFASFKASIADTTVASASASTGAVAGTYSLEVTALAQNQRLVSQQSASYTSSTSVLTATGTLRIAIGSMSTGSFVESSYKEITVGSGQTLANLRDAINSTSAGVSATIITTTNAGVSRAQLVLTSNTPGLENVAKLTGLTDFNFDPNAPAVAAGTMSQETADGGQAAQNAAFKLNGISGTATSNALSGVLDGVTLTLAKTNTGSPTTLTVTKDTTSTLKTALNAFIKAYNEAAKSMADLGAYNAETKQAGALQGDATLRGAQAQLASLRTGAYGAGSLYQTLSSIGIELQKDGSLKLDSSQLDSALAADYDGVSNLVASVGGAFKSGLDSLLGTSGNIAAATDSANRLIKDIEKRGEALSTRLTAIEARYRKQFTALDSLVASLNKTSTYLAQQLANLPGASGS
jgi:flagellar hook-associated protein 2